MLSILVRYAGKGEMPSLLHKATKYPDSAISGKSCISLGSTKDRITNTGQNDVTVVVNTRLSNLYLLAVSHLAHFV